MVARLADLFPAILIALITAIITAPLSIRLAPRWKLVDQPGSAPHKVHAEPTPLTGGIVLAISIAAAYLILRPVISPEIIGMFVGGAVILVWGVIDDRMGMAPWLKLIGQVGVCLILIGFGVQVQVTRLIWLDIAITLVWVVGLTNAFNFVDSMDGLALGLAGIASAFFMLVTIDSVQPVLSVLSAALLGASLGTFLFNAAPARLFIGDSGAQFLGFMLAAIGIAYVPAQAGLPQGVSWFTPILVMGVPIFDMSLVVFSRLRRRRPVHRGGRDHTYHRLLRLGLDSTRAVLLMQLTAVLLGLIAFIALDATVLIANVAFGVIVLAGIGLILFLDRSQFLDNDASNRFA